MDQIIKRFPNVGFIAHRGLPSKQLENTKESFLEAAKFGFFGIETDLHLTMDKIAVLHHDDNLQTFSNYDLTINETNFDKIKSIKINQNYSIPTLEDYINIC